MSLPPYGNGLISRTPILLVKTGNDRGRGCDRAAVPAADAAVALSEQIWGSQLKPEAPQFWTEAVCRRCHLKQGGAKGSGRQEWEIQAYKRRRGPVVAIDWRIIFV